MFKVFIYSFILLFISCDKEIVTIEKPIIITGKEISLSTKTKGNIFYTTNYQNKNFANLGLFIIDSNKFDIGDTLILIKKSK